MKALKIVLIGAGSASFGRGALADILASEVLKQLDVTVWLVDLDQKALHRMYKLAKLIKAFYGSKAVLKATVDRREALPDADFVITSIAQNRWEFWEKEYYVPLAYGFKHVFGENGGPGAAFHTLRSLHLMMPICEDMERLCPKALLLNFTNPESRVCLGIKRMTEIDVVGLCHGPMFTLNKIAEILEKPAEEIEITVGGINHFHWALTITDKEQGTDLYPLFRRRVKEGNWGLSQFILQMLDIYGYFTYPDASHPAEYVNFAFAEAGPQFLEWGIGKVARHPEDTVANLDYAIEGIPGNPSYELRGYDRAELIQRVVEGREKAQEEIFSTTHELTAPIIEAIVLKETKRLLAGNVVNNGSISNLPDDSIVEVPLEVSPQGIQGVKIGELPLGLAGFCQLQISIQNVLIEAYRTKSRNLLLQALLLEPTVDNAERAEAMMDTLLRLERGSLPQFK